MSIILTSHVRGGGCGTSAWVARITGTDERFGLAREFVRKQKDLSRSGRSGSIHFELEAGVYEYRNVQHASEHASIGKLDRGFVVVTAGATSFWSCPRFDRMPTKEELVDAGLTAHEVIGLKLAA